MDGWMYVHVCMQTSAANHGCATYRASTDFGAWARTPQKTSTPPGSPVTCAWARPPDRCRAGSAWERGGACPSNQCLRVLADCPPARTPPLVRECETDGSPNLAPGGSTQRQVGLRMPSSPSRRSTSSRGVTCSAAREAMGCGCARCRRAVVCRRQWVRRDGVISCRFRCGGFNRCAQRLGWSARLVDDARRASWGAGGFSAMRR